MSDTINIEISECCSGATIALLQIVGDGTDSYTNTSLIGKSILIIFIDAQKISTSAFTFNAVTGNIEFDSSIDTGAEIDIIYI